MPALRSDADVRGDIFREEFSVCAGHYYDIVLAVAADVN